MSCSRDKHVIVALDTADIKELKNFLEQMKGVISYYKIGMELFNAHGWKAAELVKQTGAKVFLDLKLHDIPTTVSKTASVLAQGGVDMLNVHALGGFDMMKKTREAVDQAVPDPDKRPKLIAVTILTSHSEDAVKNELGITKSIQNEVSDLAKLAEKAGLDGVVSSPHEIETIRGQSSKDFLIVTPGIRPKEANLDDQTRVLSPKEAFDLGASYIVVGRPITKAENPKSAAESLLSTLN